MKGIKFAAIAVTVASGIVVPVTNASAMPHGGQTIQECYAECQGYYETNHDALALARCDQLCDRIATG